MHLRRACWGDCGLLFRWSNDAEVRKWSYRSDYVSWETHKEWYSRVLSSSDHLVLIAELEDAIPIGVVRFEIAGVDAIIGVSVAKEYRGLGYASHIIRIGSKEILRMGRARTVHAYIKLGNEKSKRAFASAGYEHTGQETVHDVNSHHMVL